MNRSCWYSKTWRVREVVDVQGIVWPKSRIMVGVVKDMLICLRVFMQLPLCAKSDDIRIPTSKGRGDVKLLQYSR
jgi:hypothetical protein